MMLEPTNEQLKELHKDIMSGDVMTITTEHYKQQAERIKALEAENKDLGDGVEIVNNAGVKIRRNLEARIEELEAALKEWRDKADSELDINAGLHTENAHLQNRIKELEIESAINFDTAAKAYTACGNYQERIRVLEGAKTVETQVICGLVNCLQRNTKGECGHTSIHFQPCSDSSNVAACSEYTE